MPNNPVRAIRARKKPFIFFHTHAVSEELIKKVATEQKSIELDISSGDNGKFYIGHHLSFYKHKKIRKPKNITVEKAIEILRNSKTFVKFDCKDQNVLPLVRDLIQVIGPERSMLHAFVEELNMTDSTDKEKEQPHWKFEHISLQKLIQLKEDVGNPPLQVSCRGLTLPDLLADGVRITKRITRITRQYADVVNFNIHAPRNAVAPVGLIEKLYNEYRMLTEVYVERLGRKTLPVPYFGTTDNFAYASRLAAN